jgi:hypothetical protein
MMTTASKEFSKELLFTARSSETLRTISLALITAGLLTLPVLFLKDRFPMAVVIAIGIGAATVLFFERYISLVDAEDEELSADMIKLTEEFVGLRRLAEQFAFEIQPQLRDPKGQFYLFATPQEHDSPRKLRRVETRAGADLFVIGPDRFIELLISELLEGSDKVAELALLRAWERFGEAAGRHSDLRFFMDRLVLETVKAEFRSNWLTLISRFGETVVINLRRDLEKSYNVESNVSEPQSKRRKSACA